MRNPDSRLKPAAGLLEVDDFSIRHIGVDDFHIVRLLQESIPRDLFELPATDRAFGALIGELARKPWSLPFACLRKGEPVGICFLNVAQLKNLNGYLVALFSRPAEATLPLALYVRHAFWSFPLHRLYAQLPMLPALLPHIDVLERVAFKREGTLVAHVAAPGGPQDVLVLGLLREEFAGWCRRSEPRLALE